MRYHPLDSKNTVPGDTVAAVWPSFEEALHNRQALEPELEAAEVAPAAMSLTPAAPDVPAAVGGFIIAAYLGLLTIFFMFFTASADRRRARDELDFACRSECRSAMESHLRLSSLHMRRLASLETVARLAGLRSPLRNPEGFRFGPLPIHIEA